VRSGVVGWGDHTLYNQRVRNYTAKPIEVEVRRTLPGHVVFRSKLKAKNFDFQTVEYTATVKPGEKANLLYELFQHQGRNAKQQNVTVEEAEVR
jgi:cytochrome c oxidase assembly protein Cox11